MSSRYEGDHREPVLAEEDDWFATPFQEPANTDEVMWQDDEPEPAPHYDSDGLGQRQLVVVLAVVAVVAVIAIMILIVRAVGGDDTTTTPATVPTTPTATTPTATTPTTTTPTTSTDTTTTPADTTPTGTVTSVPAEQTLRPGTSGSSVTALQQALTQLGYDPGTPDGSYGPSTTAAVSAFQAAKGLPQDGVAGPTTLAAINTALAAG